ncbi:hypothetical protein [Metasolibacillus sp.]|uniref:hypothetical protein n=1 Tax=Metasolibacillus sp. TaxID=2703680 RepID=UPI0025EE0AE9|nr:hypothetical protein [Metasolibacillus sp.]MCT6926169.1 hypothetical protein [Metasolibacillus sp.]MCT6942398.1 hypothetical protein [Metasolibacillus sp.]
MTKYLDRTGVKYGRLTALEIDKERTTQGKARQGAFWKCQCDCGNVITVRGNMLGKQTKSCGCLKLEQDKENLGRFITGKSHSRLATIWYHMIGRCHNEKDYNYHRYGAKGIKVCDEWRNDFIKFEKWALLNGYSDDLSIDRIDVTGDYQPENCRWADFEVQMNNKRNTLFVEYEGKIMSLKQAYNLEQPAIAYQTAKTRYHTGERDTAKLFAKNRRYRGN